MVGNNASDRVIPRDIESIVSMYHKCRRLLIKRINNGRSFRYLANKFRLSHHTIKLIYELENYIPSKKVMIKIIQGIKKPKVKNMETFHPLITSIVIQGDILSTKNHTRILKNKNSGKRFVAKSKISKSQEDNLGWQLKSQKIKWGSMLEEVAKRMNRLRGLGYIPGGNIFPLRINIKFYRSTKGRFDYVNIVQGLLDAMVRVGYIPDDDADHIIPMFENYEVDEKNPRTEIWCSAI